MKLVVKLAMSSVVDHWIVISDHLWNQDLDRIFSDVRIHDNSKAQQFSQAVNARAFTIGNDIFLGRNESVSDKRLLSHELTHVMQQNKINPFILYRQEKKNSVQSNSPVYHYPIVKVKIDRSMDRDDILIKAIMRLYNISSEEAKRKRKDENMQWVKFTLNEKIYNRGYVLVQNFNHAVKENNQKKRKELKKFFQELKSEEQNKIVEEAKRRHHERTNIDFEGDSKEEKVTNSLLDLTIEELTEQRQTIHNLPNYVQKFMFTEDPTAPTLDPKEYNIVIMAGIKLSFLSELELKDFEFTILRDKKFTNWDKFEENLNQAIDQYLNWVNLRKTNREITQNITNKLYGLAGTYNLYKRYLGSRKSLRNPFPDDDDPGIFFTLAENAKKLQTELIINLQNHGFGSIEEFESAISQYRSQFIRETLLLSADLLHKYEILLMKEEKKYQNKKNISVMYETLNKSRAKEYYLKADNTKFDPKYSKNWALDRKQAVIKANKKKNAAIANAESQVKSIDGEHPLLQSEKMDLRDLAFAKNEDLLQEKILGYISTQRGHIAETRKNLNSNPNIIFNKGLNNLLEQSKNDLNITPGSITDLIITDHIKNINHDEALSDAILIVFTVILTVLTAGGGTLAAVSAGALVGMSAYDIYETGKDYKIKSAAYNVGFIANKPSLVWVAAAILSTGLDASAFALTVKALKPASNAIKYFNQSPDLVRLEKLEEVLNNLSGVDHEIRNNISKNARMLLQRKKMIKTLRHSTYSRAYSSLPGQYEFHRFVIEAYYFLKYSKANIDKFLILLKRKKLITKIDGLSSKELTLVKKALKQGETINLNQLKEKIATQNLNDLMSAYEKEVLEQIKKSGMSHSQAWHEVAVKRGMIIENAEAKLLRKIGHHKRLPNSFQTIDFIRPTNRKIAYESGKRIEIYENVVAISKKTFDARGSSYRTGNDVFNSLRKHVDRLIHYQSYEVSGVRVRSIKDPILNISFGPSYLTKDQIKGLARLLDWAHVNGIELVISRF